MSFLWNLFEWASGLRVNKEKSELFYTGRNASTASGLANILQCKVGTLPTRYLGLPLTNRSLNKEVWRGVLERVQGRIDGWQAKLLSRGGRLTLVNAVLSNLPIYYFSMFKAPKWFIRRIEALRRDFFWTGGLKQAGKGCLVAWKTVCKSKKEGGLGILDLATMNVALLTKWWWRFFSSPELLWTKLIRALYYRRRRPLWEGRSFRPASHWWKGVLNTNKIARWGVSCVLGDGRSILLWKDRWCGEVTLQSEFPAIFEGVEAKMLKISECIDHNGWIWSKILRGFDSGGSSVGGRVLEFKGLLENTRFEQRPDSVSWRWTARGSFSVKSTYTMLNDGGLRDDRALKIWKLHVPSKVQIFLWLTLKKRLPTTDFLVRRGWTGNVMCVLCGSETETVDHLFLKCAYTCFVWWKASGGWIREDPGADIRLVWENLMVSGEPGTVNKSLGRVAALWWVIWKARNSLIFQQKNSDPLLTVSRVRSLFEGWEGSGSVEGIRSCCPIPSHPSDLNV